MNEATILVERPRPRSMIVYHAIWFSLIASSTLFSIFLYVTKSSLIAVDYWVPWAGIFVGLLFGASFAYWHLWLWNTRYTVSETDVCVRSGLLMKKVKTVRLSSVKTIEVQQELVQRPFGVGDVLLYTTGHTVLVLNDLDRPEEKKEMIWKLVHQQSRRRNPYSRDDR
ncbi:MAG: PH domain-containing protein [Blastocatellia bacterium]